MRLADHVVAELRHRQLGDCIVYDFAVLFPTEVRLLCPTGKRRIKAIIDILKKEGWECVKTLEVSGKR